MEVKPYNDELKQWWIIPEGVVEQELMNLMQLQSSMDHFIGDGIGGFVFEDNSDEINIHDGQYSGQTISFEVKYVPMDEDTFETLNIKVTFILP